MIHARIDGTVVATHCHPSMRGRRMAICQPVGMDGAEEGEPVLAIDPLQAGLHQRVMITSDGESARDWVHDEHSPLRYYVIGILEDAK